MWAAGLMEGQTLNECEKPGAYDPLVAKHPGETCYEFAIHDVSAPGDTTPFNVPQQETYHEFYYDVPWNPGDQMTSFGGRFNNLEVLHHYLVFASNAGGKSNGQVDKNVLGTTLGSNATLISGWAVGGCRIEYPEHFGKEFLLQGQPVGLGPIVGGQERGSGSLWGGGR